MRVVGQDRPAGRRAGRRHDPVVAPLRRVGAVAGQDPGGEQEIGLRFRCLRRVRGRLLRRSRVRQRLLRDAHPLSRQLEHLQDPFGEARLQPVGNRRLPAVGQAPTDRVGGQAARLAEGRGAGDLGGEVPGEAVRPDPDDIVRGPAGRAVAEVAELPREAGRVRVEPVDVGVDPLDEPAARRLGVPGSRRARQLPLAGRVAPVEEEPCRPVLLDERRAEDLGELTEPPATPEVDLEEPVARRVEALHEEEVLLAPRVEVGDPPAVDQDLGGPPEAGDTEGLDRRGLPGGRGERRERTGGEKGGQRQADRGRGPGEAHQRPFHRRRMPGAAGIDDREGESRPGTRPLPGAGRGAFSFSPP